MSDSQAIAKITAAVLMLHGATQIASAHSGIFLPPPYVVIETAVTANYRIQHACDGVPVIAQSFLIPTQNPIVSRRGGGRIPDVNQDGKRDLADIIQTGWLAGQVQPFIDKRVFKQGQLKSDNLENTIGFSSTQGHVPDKFLAETPFVVWPVFFHEDSCAQELVIHPVAADICTFSSDPKPGEVNIWMEHTTSRFPHPVHGVGENSLQITFQRNLENYPLKRRCKGGFTVDVYASDEDIDANLPIPGVWPTK